MMTKHSKSKSQYINRINKALAYIDSHLDDTINLETLAQVANFSAFHFHRIFLGVTGETPNQYIKRRRIEKAAWLVGLNNKSMTQIAHECGFSSSSTFSRAFREHFGVSPSQWLQNSKNCKTNSKYSQDSGAKASYDPVLLQETKEDQTMKLEIKDIPQIQVAYVANLEGYSEEKVNAAWHRLLQWAGPRDLVKKDSVMIGIPFDNPDITDADKCRYYACIGIDDTIETTGDIGKMAISSGRYAVYHFHGTADNIIGTYRQIYSDWFPQSGYQPEDGPFFEKYLVDGSRIEEEMARPEIDMEICIPVKPL
jgi:AraC family transcriptional regulator